MIRDYLDDTKWCNEIGLSPLSFDKLASASDDDYGIIVYDDYGKVVCRKFPLSSPGAVKLAAAYLSSGSHRLSQEAQGVVLNRIQNAMWGFRMDVEAPEKVASPWIHHLAAEVPFELPPTQQQPHPSDYALQVDGQLRYPIRSEEEAKLASAWLETAINTLHPQQRREIAREFAKRASTHGVSLGENASSYIADETSYLWKTAMQKRRAIAPTFEHKRMYSNLEKSASSAPPETLAYLLAEADRRSGLDAHWDHALDDPWKTTFANPKIASCSLYEVELFGVRLSGVDLERLADLRTPYVEKTIGSDEATKFKKNPVSYFHEAPLRVKRILVNMAKQLREDER